jgi:hypothetical protein
MKGQTNKSNLNMTKRGIRIIGSKNEIDLKHSEAEGEMVINVCNKLLLPYSGQEKKHW